MTTIIYDDFPAAGPTLRINSEYFSIKMQTRMRKTTKIKQKTLNETGGLSYTRSLKPYPE